MEMGKLQRHLTDFKLAFVTRFLVIGIKQWENRSAMSAPASGQCAMTCSKSSDEWEYANFIAWTKQRFPANAFNTLPTWQQVSGWRGKLIAVCDYAVSYTPGDAVWNYGYPVWWHLTKLRLLPEPIPCRGSVGMWRLPKEIYNICRKQQLDLFDKVN